MHESIEGLQLMTDYVIQANGGYKILTAIAWRMIMLNSATPAFKHICHKWMIDTSQVRYQVAVQHQMIEKSNKYLSTLEAMMVKKYRESMRHHFQTKTYIKKYDHNNKLKSYNNQKVEEEDDQEIAECIVQNKKGDTFGKVMLTGMYLLELKEYDEQKSPPKAMLINAANSDDSMSGVTSAASRSTLGNLRWEKEIEERETTSEMKRTNEREKIGKCCVKYNINEDEVKNWVQENVDDPKDPIHKWDMQQIQDYADYNR